MGGGFYRYDELWHQICDEHGWSHDDCHGDHYDEVTREEAEALGNAWQEDLKCGATECAEWD